MLRCECILALKDSHRATTIPVVVQPAIDRGHHTGRACMVLGQYAAAHHADGLPRARALYEYSCEIEYSDGCVAAGSFYEKGHGVTASLRKAVRFNEQACQYGNFRGCYRTAKFIATAPSDEAEALQ